MLKFAVRLVVICAALGALGAPRDGAAQGVRAVQPIPGYACMSLNATEQQMMDRNFAVPIRSEPTPAAPIVGNAAAVVFVQEGVAPVNGFVRMLLLDGNLGWISQRDVKPWRSPNGDTRLRCVPSLMSNGRPGYLIH